MAAKRRTKNGRSRRRKLSAAALKALMGTRGYRPLTKDELAQEFGGSGQRAHLDALLAELIEAGEIVCTRSGRYGPASRFALISGRLQGTRRGGMFFVPEDPDAADLRVASEDRHGALHGDKVLVRRLSDAFAEVERVLERANRRIVGSYEGGPLMRFVRPLDERIGMDVLVTEAGGKEPSDGDIVVVAIDRFGDGRKPPTGHVAEVLGDFDAPGVDVEIVMQKHGLEAGFDAAALRDAEAIPAEVSEEDLKGREDLRALTIFTIDSDDAKDLDDAISLQKMRGGWRLGVHIADVSHYVRPHTALDKAAAARACSTYLVDRVLPMLPESISNGIASLHPHVDRLCLSLFLDFDSAGRPRRGRFVRSVIRSCARLSYTRVNEALAGDPPDEDTKRLLPDLQRMAELRDLLTAERLARGALDFDMHEDKVRLDADGRPVVIEKRQRTGADRLIEEFMLAANEETARYGETRHLPFLYRVHDEPNPDRLEQLRVLLFHLGYPVGRSLKKTRPAALQQVLERAQGRPEAALVQMALLRSMARARYEPSNIGHFGLAADAYTHFTSPIRRYPDLVVHRIIKATLRGRRLPARERERLLAELPDVALHCSQRERVSDEAERDSVEVKKLRFVEPHVGEAVKGVISGVTNFGFFVSTDLGVEGLVRLSSLHDDFYDVQEHLFALVGERTHRRFRLGDPVTVRVMAVSRRDRTVDLQLVDEPTPIDAARRPSYNKKTRRRRVKA